MSHRLHNPGLQRVVWMLLGIGIALDCRAQERPVQVGGFPEAGKALHGVADEDVTASEYLQDVLETIGRRWMSPMAETKINPIVSFIVGRDGGLTNVQLERSSGVYSIDQLALKAVLASSPVRPFPPTISVPRLTIHLTFTPRRLSTAYSDWKIQKLNAEGVRLLSGENGSSNPSAAAGAFQEAAGMGDASAMANLAFMYETGEGVRQDEREAAHWYLLAAELGNEIARFNIARFYESGRGVPRDPAAALRWYRSLTRSGKPVLAREARLAVERLSR